MPTSVGKNGGSSELIDTSSPASIIGPIGERAAPPPACTIDVAQQVADEWEPKADFIHQEVYVDNDIGKGVRPQLKAFGLPTEPWTYLIGADGVIKDRIQGANGGPELGRAMKTIVPG